MLEDIILQTENFLSLQKESQADSLPTAILFSSKDNFYSQQFCKIIACLIFDGKIYKTSENYLKVFACSHPDLKTYPAKDKLLVADSEEIVMESFVKPIFATKKVFIINNIDDAMDAAQNKLLKILEEPPKNVYFLLTCTHVDKVLPTIRSRCNKIELQKLSDEQIESLLQGGQEDAKDLAVAISDGQAGRALALLENKNFLSICRDAIAVITKMKSSKEVLTYSKRLQEYKDDFLLVMEVVGVAVGDLIRIKAGKTELVRLKPYLAQLNFVSSEYTIRALCEISLLVDEVLKEKFYNVNSTISLENFLLNILEVKYLCK